MIATGLHAELATRLGTLDLDIELGVGEGEVVALLGPNGAGKTTVLRTLAGLVHLDRGRVEVSGRVLTDTATGAHVGAAERRIGVVFQDDLLFGHLSVGENVAFGPRSRGLTARRARRDAASWLERVGLGDRADHRPDALSGGQARRVALARALVTEPAMLLFDEPLAALDVEVAREIRGLLRSHLRAFTGPALLVTHDPLDALTLADRLVIVEDGRVTQVGTPAEVTARPRSAWVAELVGLNLLRGIATGTRIVLDAGGELRSADPAQGPVAVVVHPRAGAVHRDPPVGSPRNVLMGEVDELDARGDHVRVRVRGPVGLVAEVTPAAGAELGLGAGGTVHLAIKATELAVHPETP